MNAVWLIDYDYRADKCYDCPCCPECQHPIWKHEDGTYRCPSCGEVIHVTDEMREWFKVREETKTGYLDCLKLTLPDGMTLGCGGKNCVETHYRRNPVTLEWQTCWGKCVICGNRFIV